MNRRGFLGALAGAPLMAWIGSLAAKASQFPNFPSTGQNQFPGNNPQQGPPGAPPMPGPPKIDPRMVLAYQQKQLRKDVSRLFELARKLRAQVEKTDSTEVLSLDMIHTAEQIENLAKHIRQLARG